MPAEAFQTFYDVSRDSTGRIVPALLTLGWLLGFAVYAIFAKIGVWNRKDRRFLWLCVVAWAVPGIIGFGNVWYRYFHCAHELKSGDFKVVEGRVTEFLPEEGNANERFTVAGVTFTYSSADLGTGGLRSTGGKGGPLHVDAYVRATYDRKGVILRLEVRMPSKFSTRPSGQKRNRIKTRHVVTHSG